MGIAYSLLYFYRVPSDGRAHLSSCDIHQVTDFEVIEEGGTVGDVITTETGYGRGIYRDAEDGEALARYNVVDGSLQFGAGGRGRAA